MIAGKTLNECVSGHMDSNTRELLYLLSVEIIIFYLLGFGFIMLRNDNVAFGGLAYSAVMYSFLAAYLLDIVAWIVFGFKKDVGNIIAIATGGVIFSTVAFLTLLLLCVMLWSNPLVCIDVRGAQAVNFTGSQYECFRKGDSSRQGASDVKYSFPSLEKYEDYRDLGNATVADIFMKVRISESDYITKLNAIFFIPLIFLIYVLQNSFFNTIYSSRKRMSEWTPTPTKQSKTHTEKVNVVGFFDIAVLFLRCALLILIIVIDTADFFPAWNVHDAYLQMIPSLIFLLMYLFSEFTYLIHNDRIRIVVEFVSSILYMIIAFFVVLYYAYPRYITDVHAAVRLDTLFELSDLTTAIVDTRPSILIVMFAFLLIVDVLNVFRVSTRGLWGLFHVLPEQKFTSVDGDDMSQPGKSTANSVRPVTDPVQDSAKGNKYQLRFDVIPKTHERSTAIDFRSISKKRS
jgi:hypothetical protein